MENIPTYHSELIIKYLAGEIADEEILALQVWLQSDPGNQRLFEEFRNTWLAIENSKIDATVVVDEEWSKLESRIIESRKYEVRSTNPAVIWRKLGLPSLPSYNSNRINFGFQWAVRIAAVFILIALPSFFLFKYFNNSREILITARNQMMKTSLPDGTSVSLNCGSTIEYPEHFNGSTREIKLTGEAFFSVKHNDKSKFVIVNGNVRIEDIGTSFYVNTNKSDGLMEVVLTEGKASVYFVDNPSGQVYILPGEKADIRRDRNTIRKSVNLDENYLAWKTRRLVFSNNTMSEIVTLLNKVYHSDIRLSGDNLNNCRLTAIFDNQTLESVLNVIKSTLDVSIISNGQTFEISGKECDL
jgi:transmembrane sensor